MHDDERGWRDAELDADFEAEAQVVAPPPGAEDRVLAAVLAATAGAGAGAGASGGSGAATVSGWVKGALIGALVGGAVVAVWVAVGSPDRAGTPADGGAVLLDAGAGEPVEDAGRGTDGTVDGISDGSADGTPDDKPDAMPEDGIDGMTDGTVGRVPDATAPARARAARPARRPARPADTLRAESTLLAAARAALAGGDPEGALAKAEQHGRRFAAGRLWQEREVIAIKALWAMGRRDAARARAERFVERAPESAYHRTLAPMLPEGP